MAKAKKNEEKTLIFHNRISPVFRSVHVDGAYGGITPKGHINLNFFSERFTIPKSTTYKLKSDLTLGEKVADSPDSIDGILRHYEIGIFADLDTARRIARLLIEKIEELENIKLTEEK